MRTVGTVNARLADLLCLLESPQSFLSCRHAANPDGRLPISINVGCAIFFADSFIQ